MSRGTGYDLEMSVTYTCTGLEKVVVWIQMKLSEVMEILTENFKRNKLNINGNKF